MDIVLVDEWINKNYDNIKMWLQNILKDEDHSVRDDLFHEILITFMEHPQAEYMINNDEARWFIVRVALNQSRSVNSQHYKLYKKYSYEFNEEIYDQQETEYDIEKDNKIEQLMNCLDGMYQGSNKERYYVMLILLYITLGNFSEVGRRLNIGRTTVSKSYKEGLELLKERYSKVTTDNIELDNKTIKILKTKILKNYGKELS